MVGNVALRDSRPQLFLFVFVTVAVVVVVVFADAAVDIYRYCSTQCEEFGERNLQELRAVEEH